MTGLHGRALAHAKILAAIAATIIHRTCEMAFLRSSWTRNQDKQCPRGQRTTSSHLRAASSVGNMSIT